MNRHARDVTWRRWRGVALWAFPLALWLVATGFFLFDLGKYSDDWALSLRVPETDAYVWPGHPWERWNYFWRPLHLIAVYGLGTALWHHDWINHLISALAHLGVAVVLWRLMRRLGASAASASAATCVFITFPIAYEAVLWPAALGSVVSVGWFLLIALMCVQLARVDRMLTRGETMRWLGGLALMCFLCASWHEQGAACVAALPALMMAVRPAGQSMRTAARRIVVAIGACGAGSALYIGLLMGSAPRGRRGSAESLVDMGDAGARAGTFSGQVADWLIGHKCLDVMHSGLGVLFELLSTPMGVLAIVLLLVTGAAWLMVATRGPKKEECAGTESARWGWVALFAVGVVVFGLAPILAVRGNFVFSRYFYPVGMGLGVLVGAMWMALVCGGGAWRRGMSAAAVAGVCVVSAAAWVHAQAAFLQRARLDERIAAGLRLAHPNPRTGTVFVPVLPHDRAVFASAGFPHGRVLGALAHPWSCWAFVQRAYARGDVSATHWRPSAAAPVVFEEDGVWYRRGIADWRGRIGGERVARENVVAFTVTPDGQVRVLDWKEARQLIADGKGK